jgi:holo-[acyl-carrier protein] synthase
MIIGIGTDLIEVDRIERLVKQHGDQFLSRCFTREERAYALARAHAAQHLAARFAVKEAVMKALGTGWGKGVRWRDIGVLRRPGEAPQVELAGGAARRARRLGVRRVHITITHLRGEAMALAIAEGDEDGARAGRVGKKRRNPASR